MKASGSISHLVATWRSYNHGVAETEVDLSGIVGAVAARVRAMTPEFDPDRFLEGLSGQLQRLIPHDRVKVLYLDEGGCTVSVFAEHARGDAPRRDGRYTLSSARASRFPIAEAVSSCVFTGQAEFVRDVQSDARFMAGAAIPGVAHAGLRAWMALPLMGVERIIGALIVGNTVPDVYTDAHLATGRQIADVIGPVIENIVLVHTERRRRQRLRVVPEVARVLATSLNVAEIFDRLAAAVRPVLDFDIMATSFVDSESIAPWLHVADGWTVPERSDRFEDFSFGTRLLSREPVLMRECESELDPTYPADRRILEDKIRSFVAVPLIFGEKVGACLGFAKRQPDWFDTSDLEVVEEIAQHVVVAIQHQRLAEEQRRLAIAEGRAQQLERRVQRLRGALSEPYGFGRILGQAPSLREALERAAQVAPQETPVLLTGESGTGKELVAQAIHYASRRADGPCVAINCAALPETLIESELFGHERGAFTGADKQKPGRFELAAGGTLFLDEVGELAAAVQAKLLRVLQEREFQRVGGTATLKADFRLIVATNRNLTDAMARGQFREDLYYRLSVFPIHLPPLRERGEDVVLLAQEFVRRLGERMGKGEPGLSRDARELLVTYPWPGNIRELQNAIERALIVSDAGLITAAQLGLTLPRLSSGEASLPAVPAPSRVANQDATAATLQELERQAIADALAKARGNKTSAAAALGITRMQLYTKLKRLGPPS
jgi:transcriptional regulator with GAF, ATPase, and Fis domain